VERLTAQGHQEEDPYPSLVLVGRDDNLTVPAFSRVLAGLIPKAQLKLISGGHGFTIECGKRSTAPSWDFSRR